MHLLFAMTWEHWKQPTIRWQQQQPRRRWKKKKMECMKRKSFNLAISDFWYSISMYTKENCYLKLTIVSGECVIWNSFQLSQPMLLLQQNEERERREKSHGHRTKWYTYMRMMHKESRTNIHNQNIIVTTFKAEVNEREKKKERTNELSKWIFNKNAQSNDLSMTMVL